MSYLLDTNVCIGWLKGDTQIKKGWLSKHPDELRLCSVVKAELLYGARKSVRVEENLRTLQRLFGTVAAVPFEDEAAHWYGLVRAELERAGTPLGPNDLMIAAIALAGDFVVVTRNTREFVRVPGLRVETW